MSHKKMGPIGSTVLTFIGYKQTDRQTDKPNLYIDNFTCFVTLSKISRVSESWQTLFKL